MRHSLKISPDSSLADDDDISFVDQDWSLKVGSTGALASDKIVSDAISVLLSKLNVMQSSLLQLCSQLPQKHLNPRQV